MLMEEYAYCFSLGYMDDSAISAILCETYKEFELNPLVTSLA